MHLGPVVCRGGGGGRLTVSFRTIHGGDAVPFDFFFGLTTTQLSETAMYGGVELYRAKISLTKKI